MTPANAITIAGLALSVYGAANLNEVSGVLIFGAGRVLDIADGYVARRTHASRFGALLDASADKAAVAAALAGGLYFEAVPVAVLGTIAAANIINASANTYSESKKQEPKTSTAGKYYMFGYNAAFGAFALGAAMEGNSTLGSAGWAIFAATTPLAIKASWDYTKAALAARKSSMRAK